MRNCTKSPNCTKLYRLKTIKNTDDVSKPNGRNGANVLSDIVQSGVRRTNCYVCRHIPLICIHLKVLLQKKKLYSFALICTVWEFYTDWWFSEKVPFCIQDLNRSLRCFKNSFRANAGMNRNMDEVPSPYFYFLPNLFKKNTTYLCETVQPIPICTNRSQTVQTEQNF